MTIPIKSNFGTIDDGGNVSVKGLNAFWETTHLTVGPGGNSIAKLEVLNGGTLKGDQTVLGD